MFSTIKENLSTMVILAVQQTITIVSLMNMTGTYNNA